MSPSSLHSFVQSNLDAALHQFPAYTIFVNLTIQIAGVDYIPDIAVYPRRSIQYWEPDPVRLTDMPALAVEIVSPTQAIGDVLGKFPIYFQAGIQSCWLVIPPAKTVTVYASPTQAQIFNSGEVSDPALQINVSLLQIFA